MAFLFGVPLYFFSYVGSGAHRSPTVFASVLISDVISCQSYIIQSLGRSVFRDWAFPVYPSIYIICNA